LADLSPGVASAISPLVRRIVAPNAGPLTGAGSNTYLVGVDEIVVVDPGPEVASHVDAIVGCGGDRIRWIAVTHDHADHAGGAGALAAATGAELVTSVDDGFGIEATEFRLEALRTPGDTVIDGSTVAVADMAAYLASLERLSARRLRLRTIAPGHGHLIDDPGHRLAGYIAHRLEREASIVAALEAGAATLDEVVDAVYVDLAPALREAAASTVHAHLLKLADDGRATRSDGAWHPRAA
jgi:glyoxylase-like metal-dependent hydrolase (beta-lactamase superfamily II)